MILLIWIVVWIPPLCFEMALTWQPLYKWTTYACSQEPPARRTKIYHQKIYLTSALLQEIQNLYTLQINLIRKAYTDQVDPYKSYGWTWSVRLIRIRLIRISLTDQLDPYDLRNTPLTHTQHKCVPRMSPTTNQPPQQWTPAPSPSPKITYLKKKPHGQEKRKNKKASQRKTMLTQLFKEEDRSGAFFAIF